MKLFTFVTAVVVFIAIVLIGSVRQYKGGNLEDLTNYSFRYNAKVFKEASEEKWSRIIWQSSKFNVENQTNKDHELSGSWAEKNPYYRHQMVTHERMLGYIADNFRTTHPELEKLYSETTDYIMRNDVLRYLVLLHDGGVSNDLDVECLVPIDDWLDHIPEDFKNRTGVVVGIANDFTKDDKSHVLGLVVWTMMAKPNQPFVRFVLEHLQKNMANVSAEQQAHLNTHELMDITGPAATSVSFMAYASEVTGTNVSYLNFTGMMEPKMMEEVLVLQIWSFGAEHQVTKAGFK